MPRGADDPTELAGRLYDQYGASLHRYALMLLGDRAAAEDAIQQVFAALIALASRTAAIDDPKHYLRRAVRNECYSALRRWAGDIARRSPDDALLQSIAGAYDNPDERLALERALRDLPAEQREVVHMKIYEGMTFHEIASQTDESINTIASRYRYAIEKMKALLR